MKKALFLAFAVLFAAVACEKESNEGGSNSPDEPVVSPAGSVAIAITDVDYTSFTLTVTPLGEPAYYAYAVFDEDMSSTINANNLYTGGYSSTAKKTETVKWTEASPSLTVNVTGLKSDTAYYVYAVAGNSEGTLGSLSSASATTLKSYDYSISILYNGYDEDTGLASAFITLGADVESARVGMTSNTDVDAALAALEAGTISFGEITSSQEVAFTVTASGTYLMVAASYAGGVVQETASAECVVDVSQTWESLGKATFEDVFFFADSYEVELEQSSTNPWAFRLYDPYAEGLEAEGYVGKGQGSQGTYFYFTVMQPGDILNQTTITENDLVYFQTYNTGYYHTTYSDYIYVCHPVVFTGYQSQSDWETSKVMSYQDNGMPYVVQLAPFYYMFNYDGGWNYTGYYGVITITFPTSWTSLGNATFQENFAFLDSYEVGLEQNDSRKSQFRLSQPYAEGVKAEYPASGTGDFIAGSSTEGTYLNFWVMDPGDKVYSVTLTERGLVNFDPYYIGVYDAYNYDATYGYGYNGDIWIYHPSYWSTLDGVNYQDEKMWECNLVLEYQDDETTPAVVQLAPTYYGIWGGWNYSQYYNVINIAFPGYELPVYDYGDDEEPNRVPSSVRADRTLISSAPFGTPKKAGIGNVRTASVSGVASVAAPPVAEITRH